MYRVGLCEIAGKGDVLKVESDAGGNVGCLEALDDDTVSFPFISR